MIFHEAYSVFQFYCKFSGSRIKDKTRFIYLQILFYGLLESESELSTGDTAKYLTFS